MCLHSGFHLHYMRAWSFISTKETCPKLARHFFQPPPVWLSKIPRLVLVWPLEAYHKTSVFLLESEVLISQPQHFIIYWWWILPLKESILQYGGRTNQTTWFLQINWPMKRGMFPFSAGYFMLERQIFAFIKRPLDWVPNKFTGVRPWERHTDEIPLVAKQALWEQMYLELDSIASVLWWVTIVHQENSLEFAKSLNPPWRMCASWLPYSTFVNLS